MWTCFPKNEFFVIFFENSNESKRSIGDIDRGDLNTNSRLSEVENDDNEDNRAEILKDIHMEPIIKRDSQKMKITDFIESDNIENFGNLHIAPVIHQKSISIDNIKLHLKIGSHIKD